MSLDYVTKIYDESERKIVKVAYKIVRNVDNIFFIAAYQHDLFKYNEWLINTNTFLIETNKDKCESIIKKTNKSFFGKETIEIIKKPFMKKYPNGFHCFLNKNDAHEFMVRKLYERWTNNKLIVSMQQAIESRSIHPCKCTDLICEGTQDGFPVIVAQKNYVFSNLELKPEFETGDYIEREVIDASS